MGNTVIETPQSRLQLEYVQARDAVSGALRSYFGAEPEVNFDRPAVCQADLIVSAEQMVDKFGLRQAPKLSFFVSRATDSDTGSRYTLHIRPLGQGSFRFLYEPHICADDTETLVILLEAYLQKLEQIASGDWGGDASQGEEVLDDVLGAARQTLASGPAGASMDGSIPLETHAAEITRPLGGERGFDV